jgi:hypothetical protein
MFYQPLAYLHQGGPEKMFVITNARQKPIQCKFPSDVRDALLHKYFQPNLSLYQVAVVEQGKVLKTFTAQDFWESYKLKF